MNLKEVFRSPGSEYRSIPFWSWNCRVTRELIDEQLDLFCEMGYGGVCIHARAGLDVTYLGEEYLQLTKYAVEGCAARGLICWLYDDDRFPSGAADGLVTKKKAYRGKYLLLSEKEPDFFPELDCLAVYELRFGTDGMASWRRLKAREEIEALKKECSAQRRIRFAYLAELPEQPWFEGQTYIDTMNPKAVSAFLQITHERYRQSLGELLGREASAIFTDEPRMQPRLQGKLVMRSAQMQEDFAVPYSPVFARELQERFAVDALDIVPAFVWDSSKEEDLYYRYIYRETLAECFTSAFLDQVTEWCRMNGILMTGHVLGEDSLGVQTDTLGDCMRCYRNMDIPGIDVLCDDRVFLTAKQAASVSRQNGCKDTMSELYGATNWDCDFKTYKLQGDWQAALGITIRVPHLAQMSLEGEGKRDWPASIFYQSPWYLEYRMIEDHFARLKVILQRGERITRVAVIHPVESMWLLAGPAEESREKKAGFEAAFEELLNTLFYHQIDFELVSEALLPSQYMGAAEKVLQVGRCRYEAVVVPQLLTMRASTRERLEAFEQAGGTVLWLGEPPALTDGMPSEKAAGFRNTAFRNTNCKLDNLVELLAPFTDIQVRETGGENGPLPILYQLRQDGTDRWLFLCQAAKRDTPKRSAYEIRIPGRYEVVCWNTQTGDTVSELLPPSYKMETVFTWDAYVQDSLLLQLKSLHKEASLPESEDDGGAAAAAGVKTISRQNYEPICVLDQIAGFSCEEPNVLLLDHARYALGREEWSKPMEILKLDNELRSRLGFLPRQENMYQPWAMNRGKLSRLKLEYTFLGQIETDAWLGLERPELYTISLNGTPVAGESNHFYVDRSIRRLSLPRLKQGINTLLLELQFHQKVNLENIYILGDFSVELTKVGAIITEKKKALKWGTITTQGMPFYTGSLCYELRPVLQKAGYCRIRVPEFKAAVLKVLLDGKEQGLIAYEPHSLELGYLEAGAHILQIVLRGNRFNAFGELHNSEPDFRWCGPDSFRTTGENWSEEYLVRPVGIMQAPVLEMSSEMP